jgi:Piwi domain
VSSIAVEGRVWESPLLLFDRAIPSQTDRRPYQGLRLYGPYDSSGIELGPKSLLFVFPKSRQPQAHFLADALFNGKGNYPGFSRMFGTKFSHSLRDTLDYVTVETGGVSSGADLSEAYRQAIDQWAVEPQRRARHEDPELALVLVPRSDRWEVEWPYYEAKAHFAQMSIPTQMVTEDLVEDPGRLSWSIANIALAAFAKLGGTPWVVAADPEDIDLVIGIGRAEVEAGGSRRRTFGYALAFVSNGEYRHTWSFTPVADEATYINRLEETIKAAVESASDLDRPPRRVVFHLTKRTGRREVEAAQRAVSDTSYAAFPLAFLRIDDSHLYDLLDASEATYAPPRGLSVHLTERRALLQTEGLASTGPPKGPVLVELDRRSSVPPEELSALLRQVFNLSSANWRGFNARAKPVTLVYGERLAELVGYLEQVARWRPETLSAKLQGRPWFL